MGKIKALILDHPEPPSWVRYVDYEDLWEIQQLSVGEPSFPVDPPPVPLPVTLFNFDEDVPF